MMKAKYRSWSELQKHNEEVRKRREAEKQEKIVEEGIKEIPQEKKTSKSRKPKNREYMVVEEEVASPVEEVKEEEEETINKE